MDQDQAAQPDPSPPLINPLEAPPAIEAPVAPAVILEPQRDAVPGTPPRPGNVALFFDAARRYGGRYISLSQMEGDQIKVYVSGANPVIAANPDIQLVATLEGERAAEGFVGAFTRIGIGEMKWT